MARRGFIAELQHQQRLAERRTAQQQRANLAAHRAAEQARNAAVRAAAASERASEADRKRLEKEAAAAHVAAMQAEVEDLNQDLADINEELDSLLTATLEVDDFVDLEALRIEADHPPFDRAELAVITPLPAVIPDLQEPTRVAVAPSTALFGRQKKTAKAEADAEAAFLLAHRAWWDASQLLPAKRAAVAAEHAAREETRRAALRTERARYDAECAQREADAAAHNASINTLIANLGYGATDAVNEYVGIVLANSVYPEGFEVEHDAQFDPEGAEVRVQVVIPAPSQIPTIKNYKYTKATDEISAVELSQRDAKTRYTDVLQKVALRTLHEVFEADRRGLLQAISLEVGTETKVPATGKMEFIPFIAVATTRERFSEIDLSGVVPAATLEHLGAAVSRNPFELVAVSGAGVRRAQ